MIRRYEESEIRSVREDLSRYVISKPCESCHGDRLNKAARNVFIQNKNLSNLTKLTIDQIYDFFDCHADEVLWMAHPKHTTRQSDQRQFVKPIECVELRHQKAC